MPGVDRHPLKKFDADENRLFALIERWKQEAIKAGCEVKRIVVSFEAERDGFWLARWLRARGIEAHMIHPTSVSVSREHRRAKTDRLDTELLKRATLGWLREKPDHCRMVAIPTLEHIFDGRSVTYGFGELDTLVPAYAATIHKTQGSEYPAVVICRDVALPHAATQPALHGCHPRQTTGRSGRPAQGRRDRRQWRIGTQAVVEAS